MLGRSLVVSVDRGLVDVYSLSSDDLTNLGRCQLIARTQKRKGTYSLFEERKVVLGQRVCLGNDWNQVDTGTEALHYLNVQGFKAEKE